MQATNTVMSAMEASTSPVGDVLDLSAHRWAFDAVVTSPPCGNRLASRRPMADPGGHHDYASRLGSELAASNRGARLEPAYREFFTSAWPEVAASLTPGGTLVVALRDHLRGVQWCAVAGWHVSALQLTLNRASLRATERPRDAPNGALERQNGSIPAPRAPRIRPA